MSQYTSQDLMAIANNLAMLVKAFGGESITPEMERRLGELKVDLFGAMGGREPKLGCDGKGGLR